MNLYIIKIHENIYGISAYSSNFRSSNVFKNMNSYPQLQDWLSQHFLTDIRSAS